jgi:carbohydrate kinase (thermoresistant glucokinase family)
MGVSGCGKSTVGQRLAEALGLPFVEGDELHPPRNVALMAAGTPLTDDDRREWLARVADVLAEGAAGCGAVVSCSALRRSYRDRLRAGAPELRLVWLHGPADLLVERLAGRTGHYMPPTLLPSQLATLEPPAPDERALALDIDAPAAELADAARRHLEKVHA